MFKQKVHVRVAGDLIRTKELIQAELVRLVNERTKNRKNVEKMCVSNIELVLDDSACCMQMTRSKMVCIQFLMKRTHTRNFLKSLYRSN